MGGRGDGAAAGGRGCGLGARARACRAADRHIGACSCGWAGRGVCAFIALTTSDQEVVEVEMLKVDADDVVAMPSDADVVEVEGVREE